MAEGTKEIHLEEHVVKYLTRVAKPEFLEYTEKDNSVYDRDLCLIREDLLGFIKDTQPKKYEALTTQYGAGTDDRIVQKVAMEVNKRKTLDVFREKVKERGQTLDLVYFKPIHSKTPEHGRNYEKNRLTIIRQLKYSKRNEKSIDIVLFVNGLPVVTLELKNALTGPCRP